MTKSLALEVGNNNGVLMHSEDAQRASQSAPSEALSALLYKLCITALFHSFEKAIIKTKYYLFVY